jgi:hypothetical protein
MMPSFSKRTETRTIGHPMSKDHENTPAANASTSNKPFVLSDFKQSNDYNLYGNTGTEEENPRLVASRLSSLIVQVLDDERHQMKLANHVRISRSFAEQQQTQY